MLLTVQKQLHVIVTEKQVAKNKIQLFLNSHQTGEIFNRRLRVICKISRSGNFYQNFSEKIFESSDKVAQLFRDLQVFAHFFSCSLSEHVILNQIEFEFENSKT